MGPSGGNLRAHTILCTTFQDCVLCQGQARNLRRRDKLTEVSLLNKDLKWVKATLVVGRCISCGADYYPDKIVISSSEHTGTRQQKLIYDAPYLRVSKHGIWVHRHIAFLQERAIIRFRSGWSNFAEWLTDNLKEGGMAVTSRQSKRLYIEHFSRRLLIFHNKTEMALLPSNTNTEALAACVRDLVGKDGGVIPTAMHHGCVDCTHLKRYPADLVQEGLVPAHDAEGSIVGSGEGEELPVDAQVSIL